MFQFLLILACIVFLVHPAIQVIRARKDENVRGKIEKVMRGWFLEEGQGLFDKDAEYTWAVQWFQWAAIPATILIVIPGTLLWEIVAATFVGFLLWLGVKFFRWFNPDSAPESAQKSD